jgi:hypothetical protein
MQKLLEQQQTEIFFMGNLLTQEQLFPVLNLKKKTPNAK